jgi:hypothetical protein
MNEHGITNLSETLTQPKRELESKHPTIQKILMKKRPAEYNAQVLSMYEHKSRVCSA